MLRSHNITTVDGSSSQYLLTYWKGAVDECNIDILQGAFVPSVTGGPYFNDRALKSLNMTLFAATSNMSRCGLGL
jgi:hypothetical protein